MEQGEIKYNKHYHEKGRLENHSSYSSISVIEKMLVGLGTQDILMW